MTCSERPQKVIHFNSRWNHVVFLLSQSVPVHRGVKRVTDRPQGGNSLAYKSFRWFCGTFLVPFCFWQWILLIHISIWILGNFLDNFRVIFNPIELTPSSRLIHGVRSAQRHILKRNDPLKSFKVRSYKSRPPQTQNKHITRTRNTKWHFCTVFSRSHETHAATSAASVQGQAVPSVPPRHRRRARRVRRPRALEVRARQGGQGRHQATEGDLPLGHDQGRDSIKWGHHQRNLINRRETFYVCTVGCVSCPLSNKQVLGQLLKLKATGACLPSILVREAPVALNFSSRF